MSAEQQPASDALEFVHPESFEVDVPKTRSSACDLVESLSLTLATSADLEFLLVMKREGRAMSKFDH